MFARLRARVRPTWARRRSSSRPARPWSSSVRWCGNRPSSQPGRNTVLNSKPLAECKVMMLTASASALLSLSITSEMCSKKPCRFSNSSMERTSSLRFSRRPAAPAGVVVQHLHRCVAEPALGHIDDALEGEIVGRRIDHAQIGQRVANFRAFVEARAADHAVGQAECDEAVLELAHLERGAHQDGDLVKRMLFAGLATALQLLDLLADG